MRPLFWQRPVEGQLPVLEPGQQVRCIASNRPLALHVVVRQEGDRVWIRRNGIERCYARHQLRIVDHPS
jgi:hypothetical protein